MTSPGKTESLDPITVEVVRYKLDGIANEMQSTLLRSSFSPIDCAGVSAKPEVVVALDAQLEEFIHGDFSQSATSAKSRLHFVVIALGLWKPMCK